MTTALDSPARKSVAQGSLSGIWQRAQGWLLEIVDRANPILVKETRQALKSRQFVVTFLVTLLACWVASFAVVGIVGMDVFYVASGDRMLRVYCAILAFPLMIIVPYTAFRSLASEQEDNTYDLLSITSLTSRQIVTGKLGSAVVQMLVYLSAVSPCIAFSFLLRGVEILTVAVLLCSYVLVSLGLSMLALLAGTLARVRYTQALMSVLIVIGLAMVFFASFPVTEEFIRDGYTMFRESEFWLAYAAVLTFYVTTFLLVHAAASAQIAFPSENRSSPLRRLMVLQQACYLGWMAVILVLERGADVLLFGAFLVTLFAGIYWYTMGTILTSEWPHLSRRVQRSLPQSTAGRALLTWFNPGPGTGYMFAIANLTTIALTGLVLTAWTGTVTSTPINAEQAVYFIILGWSYVVIFLGVGRLLISLLRRVLFVSIAAGFLLHLILLLLACGIPQVVFLMSSSFNTSGGYSLIQITNPVWTLFTLLDTGVFSVEGQVLILILPATAVVVLLLNLRSVAAELHYQRRSLPLRVAEDEAQLHPAPIPGPTNPWDAAEEK
ncbi:MAG: hypothetical protein IH898_07060 [Planctomycetes bacterium]|nr:hypothetical protein [Planctomycetota bacterium]